jgi:succinate dehydrogenase/fumarate reductase flavoprotein subunit
MTETDVVVLGSGAAGLAAALTAAVGGASVTVLEGSALFGGTSAVSGGGMWLPGNTLDPSWTDSLAGAKIYLQRLGMGLVPEAMIDRYLAESGQIPDFFAANSPLTFTADIGRPDYHAPWEGSSLTSRTVFPTPYELPRLGSLEPLVRRPGPGGILPIQHSEEQELAASDDPDAINKLIRERLAKGVALRGLALVGGLMEGCVDHGVSFVAGTRGRSLIVSDGRVAGLRAFRDGEEVSYPARMGVVLASGGFEWNRDLWDAFMAVPWDGPATPPVNEGDGLIMAAAAGAKLANLDKATWIPVRYSGEEYDGRPYARSGGHGQMPGEIIVNRRGHRFTNETLNYNDIGRNMTHFDPGSYEFDNHPSYVIGDKHTLTRLRAGGPALGPDQGDGWAAADTLRELAGQLGIDADGLSEQVRAYNEHAADGIDPVFHRGEKPWEIHYLPGHRTIGPVTEGPFVGYRVRAGVFGTRGGPVINENAQIVDFGNQPIPGLYGAGNVVAHPFASAYPGGGGTLGPAVTFGHVAGKSVLSDKGRSA